MRMNYFYATPSCRRWLMDGNSPRLTSFPPPRHAMSELAMSLKRCTRQKIASARVHIRRWGGTTRHTPITWKATTRTHNKR